MIAASSRSVNSPQLMLCTGGSNIQNRKTYVDPDQRDGAGHQAGEAEARGSAGTPRPGREPARRRRGRRCWLIRFIAISPPRPSAKAGSTGQSRLVSGPSAVVW